MAGRLGKGSRARRARPAAQVAAPVQIPNPAPQPPVPVALLPEIDAGSPEARAEMQQVVRDHFPIPDNWTDICVEIIRTASFEDSARFIGDEGGMNHHMLFWAIQEAESSDPVQAARWRRFKSQNPSRLNIRRPSVVEIANIPPEALPPGVTLPRLP